MFRTRKQVVAILMNLKKKGLLREISSAVAKSTPSLSSLRSIELGLDPIPLKISKSASRWSSIFNTRELTTVLQDIPPQDRIRLNIKGIYVLDGAEMGRTVREHMFMSTSSHMRASVELKYKDAGASVFGAHIRGRIFLNAEEISKAGEEMKNIIPDIRADQTQRAVHNRLTNTLLHEAGHNLDSPKASPGKWKGQTAISDNEDFIRAVIGHPGARITDSDRADARERFAQIYVHWTSERGLFELMEKTSEPYRAFRKLMEES